MSRKRIKELKTKLSSIVEELNEKQSNLYFICKKCNKRFKYKNLNIFIQEWYVEPFSCTGGDYWETSKDIEIMCPNCDTVTEIDRDHNDYWIAKTYNSGEIKYENCEGTIYRVEIFKKLLKKEKEIEEV
jgi:Fe2+ or Zn2+ uptake regulation protein